MNTLTPLKDQYKFFFAAMRKTVSSFSDEAWIQGFGHLRYPWKLALHSLDCIDYRFQNLENWSDYHNSIGKGWWEFGENECLTQEAILEFICEVERTVMKRFETPEWFNAHSNFELHEYNIETAIYILGHAWHHHGSMATLAKKLGHTSQ